MIRQSKILCLVGLTFHCLLVVFGNVTDYYTNFSFVEHAMVMKDIFPTSLITYRAITSPFLHHAAYLLIIDFEVLITLLCGIGAWKLFRMRYESAQVFNDAKNWAIVGLTLGFLTWQVLFMSVGGEWFGVWMSPSLRGSVAAAFQIVITFLVILIYLIIKDE